MIVCERCGTECADWGEFNAHIGEAHGITDVFETWPDGGLVIIDNTLDPDDFQIPPLGGEPVDP